MSKSNPEAEDVVNPPHYRSLDPEPIAVIERWGLGFHLGNAVKYIARAGRKTSETIVDDLKKARWYVNRALVEVEPDAEAIRASVTSSDASDRLEAALVQLDAVRRDALAWRLTARELANALSVVNPPFVPKDPIVERVLAGEPIRFPTIDE